MAGRNRDPRKPRGKKPLSNGWIVVPSKTYPDRVYFYNTVTRCSTWNNPCGDRSDDSEFSSSSAEKTLPEKSYSLRKKQKPVTSHLKKKKSKTFLNSTDTNSNIRVNSEIEDYDDQDAYFSDAQTNALNASHSKIASPPSSPDSVFSFKTNISDTDNLLLESNKKQLWTHFVSNSDKPKVKKSVALSDFLEASTSHNPEMDRINDNNSIKGFAKNKTKKAKKQRTESKKKSGVEKINKNVSFKNTDKTPSQTRLLKLRKQNAEKLKELAAKYPELGIDIDGHSKKLKRDSNVFPSDMRTENTGFNGTRQFTSGGQGTNNNSSIDFSEEMDWEPSSEESDVRNINEFRQQSDKPSEVSSSDFFGLNSEHTSTLPSKSDSWFLVLDTNIFVSCLPFVKELRDTKVTDLGYPIIYVPWRVLQELDHLKNTKLESVDRNLVVNVRRAISYLNDNFKSRHPRIFGQSLLEFDQLIDFNTSDFAPDDEILQTCIQLQKRQTDKKLMLLTNDKNLESKAIVSGVEVYSKDRFQKKYLKSGSVSTQHPVATPQLAGSALNKSPNIGGADDCLCQVKVILKDFLTMVVETEMSVAFEVDWIKVVVKKPPWSLQDVMKCLLKHWRSVFFLNFSKDTHSDVEALNEQLFKRVAVSAYDVTEIIRTIQRLMISIKKSQKKKRPYLDVIPATMTKLNDFLKILSIDQVKQPEVNLSSLPSIPGISFTPQVSQTESSSSDISKAKILFKEIWDSLRNFCCSISDIIHSSGPNTETIVQEMRVKLSQILNEVGELVVTIEKILALNPSEISEHHPVIIHFSNFLSLVYPNMVPNLKSELPRCLATFFTDFEGRSLISISLKDFKEFIQDLAKAAEYFSAQSTC